MYIIEINFIYLFICFLNVSARKFKLYVALTMFLLDSATLKHP